MWKYLKLMILPLSLYVLAGAANGVMDASTHHYTQFKQTWNIQNDQYWNPAISWTNKYSSKMPDALTDAWHLSKSIMLGAMATGAALYGHNVLQSYRKDQPKQWWVLTLEIAAFRCAFSFGFSLIYDWITYVEPVKVSYCKTCA